MSVLGHMKGCLFLVAIVAVLGFFALKFGVSDNPARDIAEAAAIKPPVNIDFEVKRWPLGLGGTEHLKFTNKADKLLVVSRLVVIRPDGKTYPVYEPPAVLKPNEVLDFQIRKQKTYLLLQDNFLFKKGDVIEAAFEGFPVPYRLTFE